MYTCTHACKVHANTLWKFPNNYSSLYRKRKVDGKRRNELLPGRGGKSFCRSFVGESHDQADAEWIVIRTQLRGHNDMPFGRPTPSQPIGHPGVGHPQGISGVILFLNVVYLTVELAVKGKRKEVLRGFRGAEKKCFDRKHLIDILARIFSGRSIYYESIFILVSPSRPVREGVSTDGQNFHPGPPCPTLIRPAGGPPPKRPYGRVDSLRPSSSP
jgi:hypothetical protein